MSESVRSKLSGGVGSMLVGLCAALAVVTVSEIAARDSFAAFLRQQGDVLRAEYFESTRNRLAAEAVSSQKQDSEIKERNLSDEIDAIRLFEQQVRMLGSLGAMTSEQTLDGVRRRFEAYRINRDNRAALTRITADLNMAELQLASAKRKQKAAEDEINSLTEAAKAGRELVASRRSAHAALVKDRETTEIAYVTTDSKLASYLAKYANPSNSPEAKEFALLKEELNRLSARRENLRLALESFGKIDAPTPGSTTESLERLKAERALALEKASTLEISVAAAKEQRALYKSEASNPVDSLFSPPFGRLHSDYLLALSIMACSALGALIVGLRGALPTTLKDVTLGIASGFVCYFAIKGGKYVFILSAQSDLVSFNPYGSAFAGLLVGLFSERVYGLLTALVGDLEKRIRLAITTEASGQLGPPATGAKDQPVVPVQAANQPDALTPVKVA